MNITEDAASVNVPETFELLFGKDNKAAYQAMQELKKESEKTNHVYAYMDRLRDMLDDENSYIRTRGLTLIAYNAKWDTENKIDEMIEAYLRHITDIKPITARQCIQLLPLIAREKLELREDILSALYKADITFYKESMQGLIYQDIRKAWKEIQEQSNIGFQRRTEK